MPTSDEKLFAALIHGFAVIGFPFVSPLVGYLVFRERGGFVLNQAREGLNFQLTVILGSIALALTIIGIPFIAVYLVFAWICLICATIQVFLGKEFRFPLSIRFIK